MDFTYVDEEGEVHTWSFPGRGSYSVAFIMAKIGITGEITGVELNCIEGEEEEGSLYLEEKEHGTYLTSDVAFDDTYELNVTVNNKLYTILVTDAETDIKHRIVIEYQEDAVFSNYIYVLLQQNDIETPDGKKPQYFLAEITESGQEIDA